jgi:hypothetical protein
MIFLLVLPVHFAYNAAWLLFQGNWDHPPAWAFLLPMLEVAFSLLILRLPPPNPELPSPDL